VAPRDTAPMNTDGVGDMGLPGRGGPDAVTVCEPGSRTAPHCHLAPVHSSSKDA
jgi:hypothetical protein